jgi:hypothetical protein
MASINSNNPVPVLMSAKDSEFDLSKNPYLNPPPESSFRMADGDFFPIKGLSGLSGAKKFDSINASMWVQDGPFSLLFEKDALLEFSGVSRGKASAWENAQSSGIQVPRLKPVLGSFDSRRLRTGLLLSREADLSPRGCDQLDSFIQGLTDLGTVAASKRLFISLCNHLSVPAERSLELWLKPGVSSSFVKMIHDNSIIRYSQTKDEAQKRIAMVNLAGFSWMNFALPMNRKTAGLDDFTTLMIFIRESGYVLQRDADGYYLPVVTQNSNWKDYSDDVGHWSYQWFKGRVPALGLFQMHPIAFQEIVRTTHYSKVLRNSHELFAQTNHWLLPYLPPWYQFLLKQRLVEQRFDRLRLPTTKISDFTKTTIQYASLMTWGNVKYWFGYGDAWLRSTTSSSQIANWSNKTPLDKTKEGLRVMAQCFGFQGDEAAFANGVDALQDPRSSLQSLEAVVFNYESYMARVYPRVKAVDNASVLTTVRSIFPELTINDDDIYQIIDRLNFAIVAQLYRYPLSRIDGNPFFEYNTRDESMRGASFYKFNSKL